MPSDDPSHDQRPQMEEVCGENSGFCTELLKTETLIAKPLVEATNMNCTKIHQTSEGEKNI